MIPNENFCKVPSTRYYGSKRRFLPWLHETFQGLDFKTALDGFGGTASVSLLLSALDKKVTFNDAFLFNTICAKALFLEKKECYVSNAKNSLLSIKPVNGFISETFDKIFYTDHENTWLDGCMNFLSSVQCENTKTVFIYGLMQACLKKRPFNLYHRANLEVRLRKVDRTFGNYNTWNKTFEYHISQTLDELNTIKTRFKYKALIHKPVNALDIEANYDLVYFDPPYIKKGNNYDDYNRKYHFLEGLVNYANWPKYLQTDSKIREYLSNDFIKDWNSPVKYKDLLFSLVEKHRKSIVVLSYSDDGLPTIRDLRLFFKQNFSKFSIKKMPASYALSKNQNKEVIIIGMP